MRSFIVSGAALVLAALLQAGSASAQSEAEIPSFRRPPAPPAYDNRPPPDYYRPQPRPYYRPPAYDYQEYPYQRPRPNYGSYSAMCVTSRGTCSTGRPLRRGTPCRCFIPGFGQKRGAVEAY